MYFVHIRASKSVLLMKFLYAFIYVRVGNKSVQFVMKQLPAGAVSYSIDTALA